METVDLKDVAIFSTGTWEGKGSPKGGSIITDDYLSKVVESFNKVGDKVKPRMLLTHDGKRSEGITGAAAIGWLKNIRKNGGKLVTDIMNVPKKIADLIDVKALGRFSPGIWENMNIDGQTFENVIDHVALLGTNIPANTDLDGFIDLYENNFDGDMIIYKNIREADMPEVKELQEQITNFESKMNDIEDKNSALAKENEDLKAEIEKVNFEKKEQEIKLFLDGQIKDEKITPAEADGYMKLALGENVEDAGEVKEFSSRFDIVKDIIGSKKEKTFGKDSEVVDVPEDENKSEDDILHEKAIEYQKENNCEYKEALFAVVEDK